MKSILSEDQVRLLGEKLLGTRRNVYGMVSELFGGVDVADEVFDDLEERCGLFRCENCDAWLPNTQKNGYDNCLDCG